MYKFLMALITILILIITIMFLNRFQPAIQVIEQEGSTIQPELIIDKKVVINKLTSIGEISGLKTDVNKLIPYKDYNTKDSLGNLQNIGFIKKLSKRDLTLNTTASVKLGFDIYDIKEEDIIIDKSTIYIKSPEVKILSVEINSWSFREDVAMLGEKFTEQDKTVMYELARDKIKKDIMGDAQIVSQAKLSTQQIIIYLLSVTPGVEKIVFN